MHAARRARHLDWSGCFNARDLGGLRTEDGRSIRWGAAVRSDALNALDDAGWRALTAHGIRTIVDLRNDSERGTDELERPEEVTTLHLPIDKIEDRAFWDYWSSGWQFGTPLYYQPHVARFPERSARVLSALAHAPPGGVLFHCVGGRDRTGMVALLLLALLGVRPAEIAADYALSRERLAPLYERRGERNPGPEIDEFLAKRGSSLEESLLAALASIDLDVWRRDGGITERDVAALRARMLD
jgi:protein tyrosine/serine phosphatase